MYPTGVLGSTAACGRKPPSLPICTMAGPLEAGSGTPPSRPSVGQLAGRPLLGTAGTMATSPASPSVSVPFDFHICPFDFAQYIWRLRVRSLEAFSIRNRYALGPTFT